MGRKTRQQLFRQKKKKKKKKKIYDWDGRKIVGQSGVAQACPTAIKRRRRYSSRLIGFH